jgi:cytochrome c biogenesis protein CcmG/thiol:disulfide interchange protein DsbE
MSLVAAALWAAACSGDRRSSVLGGDAFRPLEVGDTVPTLAVRSVTGDSVILGGAQPLTLLNVWATWCTSCREEMGDLEALQREFGPRGLRVIAVSVDQTGTDRVRRFAEGEKLGFIVAHDPGQAIQQLYQVVGVPETFLIGPDGRLLWRGLGNIRPSLDSVRKLVRARTN